MKYIFFLILLFSLNIFSYAQTTHFDLTLSNYLIDESSPLEVNFKYLLSGYKDEDFLVRPMVGNGVVEIFNEEKETWISQFDLMNNLPLLQKSMKVRFKGLKVYKSYLMFEIYNKKTGDLYNTPKKMLWTKSIYSDYVDKVNFNLGKMESLKDEATGTYKSSKSLDYAVVDSLESNLVSDLWKNIPKVYFLFFSLGVFLLSIVIGMRYRAIKKGLSGKIY